MFNLATTTVKALARLAGLFNYSAAAVERSWSTFGNMRGLHSCQLRVERCAAMIIRSEELPEGGC